MYFDMLGENIWNDCPVMVRLDNKWGHHFAEPEWDKCLHFVSQTKINCPAIQLSVFLLSCTSINYVKYDTSYKKQLQ